MSLVTVTLWTDSPLSSLSFLLTLPQKRPLVKPLRKSRNCQAARATVWPFFFTYKQKQPALMKHTLLTDEHREGARLLHRGNA